MRIIVLIGEASSGKTTTLKKLITSLCAWDGKGLQTGEYTCLENQDRDVEVHKCFKGISIVVCTMGDYYDYYKKMLNQYCSADVLVLSLHPNHRVFYRDTISCDSMATFVLKEKCGTKKDQDKSDRKHVKWIMRIIKSI